MMFFSRASTRASSKIMAVSVIVAASSACSTEPPQKGLVDLPQAKEAITGFALPIEMKTESDYTGTGGCTIMINPIGSYQSYEINFGPGTDTKVVNVPPGNYYFKRSVCDFKEWDLSFSKITPFSVVAGKISLLSGIHLVIGPNGHHLNFRLSKREQNQKEALTFFGRLPESQKPNIISGYTKQVITEENLKAPTRYNHWELMMGEDPKAAKSEHMDWPNIKDCYKGEASVNGLWLGSLEVKADYQDYQFTKLEIVPHWSTFTPQLQNCVSSVLKAFQPPRPRTLHYHIYI